MDLNGLHTLAKKNRAPANLIFRTHLPPGVAVAAAVDNQDVLVPGVLGIFRAAGGGKLFRLGQRDVPVRNRIDIGGNIRCCAP